MSAFLTPQEHATPTADRFPAVVISKKGLRVVETGQQDGGGYHQASHLLEETYTVKDAARAAVGGGGPERWGVGSLCNLGGPPSSYPPRALHRPAHSVPFIRAGCAPGHVGGAHNGRGDLLAVVVSCLMRRPRLNIQNQTNPPPQEAAGRYAAEPAHPLRCWNIAARTARRLYLPTINAGRYAVGFFFSALRGWCV